MRVGAQGRWARVVVGAAAVALVGGCGNSNDSPKAAKDSGTADRFTISVGFEVTNLDPHSGQDAATNFLFHNVSQTLVEPTFKGSQATPTPMLAESWKQDDAKTWTFQLREGVKFSNGEPFDGDSVKYSVERYMDPKTQAGHASSLDAKSVEVADPLTVRITTNEPNPNMLRALYDVAMLPPKAAAADPDAFVRQPVGTGPYVIKTVSPDGLELALNDSYWDKAKSSPLGRKVIVQARPEAATRIAALEAGEADVAANVPVESVKQLPAVKSQPANENLQLRLNAQDGIFRNAKLREAVVLGTNTEEIRKSLYTDEYSQSSHCQLAPPHTFGFDPDLQAPAYDPERAKQLIQESGYNGQTIKILSAKGRYPKADEAVAAIASQWEDLGLNVKYELVPTDPWIAAIYGEEKDGKVSHKGHDAITAAFTAFALTAIEPVMTVVDASGTIQTFPHDQNPEVQPLLEKAKAATDPDEQIRLTHELAAAICAANAFIFVGNYDILWGVKEGSAFEPRPDGRIILDSKH
jgi:peptide/nickel transport system substrate-binding protein